MNWINNLVPPKVRGFLATKREVPDKLWVKCPESGQMVFYKDLEANQFVVPGSNFHMRMAALPRLKSLFDKGEFTRIAVPAVPLDPLKFKDGRRYIDRLKDAKTETELDDAVVLAEGKLDGRAVTVAAQDFRFMGGSLGMAAGEAVLTGMLRAVEMKTPFILFAASGGARMQEGILSLMQMPRTTIGIQRLRDARLPYLVVLTDPTTGGVTASYAMLGDVHIAEPGALICFAGPRVIQQTIREQLPEGFQRAEYLLEHGMIDMVVHRHKLRETLSKLCAVLGPARDMRAGQTALTVSPTPPKMNGSGSGVQGPAVNGYHPAGTGVTAAPRGEAKVSGAAAAAAAGAALKAAAPEPVPNDERFVPKTNLAVPKVPTNGQVILPPVPQPMAGSHVAKPPSGPAPLLQPAPLAKAPAPAPTKPHLPKDTARS